MAAESECLSNYATEIADRVNGGMAPGRREVCRGGGSLP